MGRLATLPAGGSMVVQRRFDAAALIGLIARHRATTVWLAPAMVNAVLMADEVHRADLGSLRVIMSGGEKMPEARLKQILDLLPGVWFADAYGLTETVSSDTFMPFESMHAKLGSVGKPLPHNRVRVADDSGVSVPPGVIGEVLVLVGAAFTLLAGIGTLRFSDVFARMHALGKASTLGLLLVLLGAAVP